MKKLLNKIKDNNRLVFATSLFFFFASPTALLIPWVLLFQMPAGPAFEFFIELYFYIFIGLHYLSIIPTLLGLYFENEFVLSSRVFFILILLFFGMYAYSGLSGTFGFSFVLVAIPFISFYIISFIIFILTDRKKDEAMYISSLLSIFLAGIVASGFYLFY